MYNFYIKPLNCIGNNSSKWHLQCSSKMQMFRSNEFQANEQFVLLLLFLIDLLSNLKTNFGCLFRTKRFIIQLMLIRRGKIRN